MRCIHCGKTTEGTFVYCPHCGKRRPKTIDEMKVEIEHEQAKRKRSGERIFIVNMGIFILCALTENYWACIILFILWVLLTMF